MSSPAAKPTPDEEEPLSITCGVLVYAGALVWLALCAGGVLSAFDMARTPAVDVAARCELGAPAPCLSSVQARAAHGGAGFFTEGGVVIAELVRPVPAERRVVLEYWAGELVSVYDPAARMRYRTSDWEQGWRSDDYGPIVLLLVSALFAALPLWGVACATFLVLRLGVRRLRRTSP